MRYVNIKKQIFDQLKIAKKTVVSKLIESTIIRSINLLLEGNDLGLVFSPAETEGMIDEIDVIVLK